MPPDSFLSLEGEATFETSVKHSKFIARAFNVCGEDEAIKALEAIRKKESGATHNCYAYILSPQDNAVRFSDDGEPPKTAGLPILEAIKGRKLFNAMVIVTRYFGGVLLGTGGLVKAYGGAAAGALGLCVIKEHIKSNMISVKASYGDLGALQRVLSEVKAEITEINYDDGINIFAACPLRVFNEAINRINDISGGKAQITVNGTKYYPYKIF